MALWHAQARSLELTSGTNAMAREYLVELLERQRARNVQVSDGEDGFLRIAWLFEHDGDDGMAAAAAMLEVGPWRVESVNVGVSP